MGEEDERISHHTSITGEPAICNFDIKRQEFVSEVLTVIEPKFIHSFIADSSVDNREKLKDMQV